MNENSKTRDEVIELVRCAELNLLNLARAVPHIKEDAYFKIVKLSGGYKE